jgi:hypothetical protein
MTPDYKAKAYDNFVLFERLFFDDLAECVTLMDGKQVFHENEAYFFHFYKWAIAPTWIDTETTPHMICGVKGYIPQLENKKFDQRMIDHLNDKGLNIYLYEVLTFGLGKIDRYDEFNHPDKEAAISETIIKHCSDNMVFDCTPDQYSDLRCYEFESISLFAQNNNLKKVNVYGCHYNVKKYFQHKYPNINLYCKDLHLASMIDYPPEDQYPFFKTPNLAALINRKFVCPNWRYHTTRHVIMSYLVNKSGHYSWYFNGSLDVLKKNLWFDLENWKTSNPSQYNTLAQGVEELNARSPLKINIEQTSIDINGKMDYWKFPGNYTGGSPSDYRMDDAYLDSFCVVANETMFAQPMGIFSEKAVNAIKLGRPFIIVAPPYTLEYMRRQGFQTFGRFWDESYDLEEDPEQRILKILQVIDFIDSKDINELRVMYSNMEDILENNVRMLEALKTKQWVFD